MPNSPEILRLRVLLCFLQAGDNGCTVTGLAKTLGEEKYTVSRIITTLGKEQLIDKTDARHPRLTEKGIREAERYSERISTTISHLMYEGVDIENARSDAFYWTLYCSEKTMDIVRATAEQYKVKYQLRDRKSFNGDTLCKMLKDGSYSFPFMVYRENIKNGTNLSMGNNGFEQPCVLNVKDGTGTINLRAIDMNEKSALNGKLMSGKINSLKYLCNGEYANAEINGDILQFPASVLNFVNIGSGIDQILHGSVCVKMQCSVGTLHMPESVAIFTILI